MPRKNPETAVAVIPAAAKDVTPFTAAEKKALSKAESVIEAGMRSFVEVGQALASIRDGRLYRATHPTFEAYVAERFHWERRQAYRYIEAAVVQENVSSKTQLPSLSHAALLAPLPAEKQLELAPRIADMTVSEATGFIRDLGKVPQAAVKRVQELFKDVPEPENGLVAFKAAAEGLNMQVLTVEELSEVAVVIQGLANSYKAERGRR